MYSIPKPQRFPLIRSVDTTQAVQLPAWTSVMGPVMCLALTVTIQGTSTTGTSKELSSWCITPDTRTTWHILFTLCSNLLYIRFIFALYSLTNMGLDFLVLFHRLGAKGFMFFPPLTLTCDTAIEHRLTSLAYFQVLGLGTVWKLLTRQHERLIPNLDT